MMDHPDRRGLPLLKIIKPLSLAAFAFVAGVILYCAFAANSETTVFDTNREVTTLTAYADVAQTREVSGTFHGDPQLPEVFYATLPDEVAEDSALMLQSAYCRTEVFAKNTLLGSYGTKMPLPFGQMTGNIRVVVPIDPSYAGSQIIIRYASYYDTNVDYPTILLAPIGTLQLQVFFANLPRIMICIVLLTMALAALCMSLYEMLKGSSEIVKMLLSFVAFVFCVLVWIVCSSDIPQFFTNNNETVSLISFLALSVLAIPFSSFCAQILTTGRGAFEINARVGWVLPVTICICFVTDLCDPYHLLILTHLYIAVTLIMAIVCVFKQWKYDRGVRLLAFSLIALFAFALIGLILFYISKTGGYDAVFFGGGLALFILMLFALILNRQMGYYEQRRAAEIYKELAYSDFLTQIQNRTAFEAYLSELNTDKKHVVTLFVLDLNGLKGINDKHGHQYGDRAIVAAAACVEKTFRGKGRYYRIGGDEFCAIVVDDAADPVSLVCEFREQVERYNKNAELAIQVAIGYASAQQDGGISFFRDLFAKADQAMYLDKQRLKEEKRIQTDK